MKDHEIINIIIYNQILWYNVWGNRILLHANEYRNWRQFFMLKLSNNADKEFNEVKSKHKND